MYLKICLKNVGVVIRSLSYAPLKFWLTARYCIYELLKRRTPQPGGGGVRASDLRPTGGARLGPTADGRGGGVGRCAPIWVLINPFALVRDDQSLQRPFAPVITRSR